MIDLILAHPILFIATGTVLTYWLLWLVGKLIDAYNQTRPRWPK